MEVIHIVLGKANPNRLNGVNKVVYNMATEQHKAGKNVSVWGIANDVKHDYPKRIFKTILFKSEWFPWAISGKLKRAILQNKRAVFHLHGGWIPLFSSLAVFFDSLGIKFVLTPHGSYNTLAMDKSARQKKVYHLFFEKKLVELAHKIHCIGKSEIIGLHKICENAKPFLLPYGFEYTPQNMVLSKEDSFTIGFVGRLDIHTKGLDLLMEAFLFFQKSHPNSRLWLIGEGEGRALIERFIREQKIKNVVLWGKKFGEEKDALIQKMHVFAHPSRNEGMPTAVLEALSLGVPTIVTHATNIGDYVHEYNAGIVIPDGNPAELFRAMESLYLDFKEDRIETYVQNGKLMLQEKFSWSNLVEKLDELYL
ncbi:MAG: glycosyltransferase family 4 protein [Bacteroidales bacterium]|nr:glycosyltransferase family 4 protein [Bacteroidales bacterium]